MLEFVNVDKDGLDGYKCAVIVGKILRSQNQQADPEAMMVTDPIAVTRTSVSESDSESESWMV